MNIVEIARIDSTNTYMRVEMADAPHGTILHTPCQVAGRGQRGNSWEAEPGMNVSMSIMLRPHGIPVVEQYAISEAVALGVVDALKPEVPNGHLLRIKWPNDIYYADNKLCGILIENALSGSDIVKSIAGIGINVNQTEFKSDAPNPISLRQLSGICHDRHTILEKVGEQVLKRVESAYTAHGRVVNARDYHNRLWRRDGQYLYRYPNGESFNASIVGVAPTGHITLKHADGTLTTHAFKEIISVL